MTRLGELGAVLLEQGLRLVLSGLGALHAALDGIPALRQHLLDAGEDLLAEETEDDEEAEQADDDLGPSGEERVHLLLGRELSRDAHIWTFLEWVCGGITCCRRRTA